MVVVKYQKAMVLGVAIIAVIAIVWGYRVLTMPDQRTPIEKVGDAVSELKDGGTKAGRQLEDRTPGEKLGDAVEDAGSAVKEKTAP